MKRSAQQIGKGLSVDSPPKLKRAHTDSHVTKDSHTGDEGHSSADTSLYLVHQNKEMSIELRRQRRLLRELRSRIETYNKQYAQLEETIGFIDRVWNQFESDISSLLQTIGEKEMSTSEPFSSLLKLFLDSGSSYFENIPHSIIDALYVDEWSTEKDIDVARNHCLDDMDSIGLDTVRDQLSGKLEFTKKQIQKLCTVINNKSNGLLCEKIDSLSSTRATQAEILLIKDQLVACQKEVINVKCELVYTQRKLRQAERLINTSRTPLIGSTASKFEGTAATTPSLSDNPSSHDIPLLAKEHSSSNKVSGHLPSISETEDISEDVTAEKVSSAQQHEVLDREQTGRNDEIIETLNQQIADAESRARKAQTALTEYMSSQQSEQEISKEGGELLRVQKQLADLRKACNKQVAELNAEKASLQSSVTDLERMRQEIVQKAEDKIEEISVAAEEGIQKSREERDEAVEKLRKAEVETAAMSDMKLRISEMQNFIDSSHSRIAKLNDRITALNKSLELTQKNLAVSRDREVQLEHRVQTVVTEMERRAREAAADQEEGMVYESSPASEEVQRSGKAAIQHALAQAQTRASDVESELRDAKANMEDLIMELEAVAADEEKSKEQNARLLKQLAEVQDKHIALSQENLKLHQDIAALVEKNSDIKKRLEQLNAHVKQIEGTATLMRQSEQAVRNELLSTTANLTELRTASEAHNKTVEDLEMKFSQSEQALMAYRKKLSELKNRCNELSDECESERKKRMQAERCRRTQAEQMVSEIKPSEENEEPSMLDMTLSMLRCSVCKDRFKQVAITRCFHMFCKECIDENLRSRNRKCPACGEKFGQDDVKTVYFTH